MEMISATVFVLGALWWIEIRLISIISNRNKYVTSIFLAKYYPKIMGHFYVTGKKLRRYHYGIKIISNDIESALTSAIVMMILFFKFKNVSSHYLTLVISHQKKSKQTPLLFFFFYHSVKILKFEMFVEFEVFRVHCTKITNSRSG